MKATLQTNLLFLLSLTFPLAGCVSGGGGGGGGASATSPQPIEIFSSWDSISPSSSVQSHSVTISGNNDEPRSEEITLDYDDKATLNQLTIGSDDNQEQIFKRNEVSNIEGASYLYLMRASSDETDWLVGITPETEDWKYQSMALWLNEDENNIDVGVLSFGNITLLANINHRTKVNFTGKAIGLYVDAQSNRYLTEATINASLQANTIELEATDTKAWRAPSITDINIIPDATSKTRDSNLDFMTDLTYNSSDNSYDAVGETKTGSLRGTVTARFYGPEAQELGGVFRISDDSGGRYSGAFGAKIGAIK